MNQITVEDLEVKYGDLQVLWGVSLEVRESDQIVSIVGPNGAGKTTLLHALSGIVSPSGGRIELFGTDLSELSSNEIVEQGFVQVTEERNLFNDLSVYQNLRMGAYTKRDTFEATLAEVYEMFPILEERREQAVGTLSGGEQQMVAIGRGLMAQPDVLALDEPSGALAPQLVTQVFEKIEEISSETTIVLIEQHVGEALRLADHAYLLENGRIVQEGTGDELLENPELIEGYL